jgi:hypothetical protein
LHIRQYFGYEAPFLVFGLAFILISTPMNALIIPAAESTKVDDENNCKKSQRRPQRSKLPHFAVIAGCLSIVAFSWAFLETTLAVHLRQVTFWNNFLFLYRCKLG